MEYFSSMSRVKAPPEPLFPRKGQRNLFYRRVIHFHHIFYLGKGLFSCDGL
jgi:hypothetical protein